MDQPIKKVDRYRGLKYLGYKMSQLPDTHTFQELVRYAKFYLASKTKRLMKDPIWEEYTIEELLVEFYAHLHNDSKEFRLKFEESLGVDGGDVDDFVTWADKQIKEEAKVREKTLDNLEDNIRFNPNDVMGDDE